MRYVFLLDQAELFTCVCTYLLICQTYGICSLWKNTTTTPIPLATVYRTNRFLLKLGTDKHNDTQNAGLRHLNVSRYFSPPINIFLSCFVITIFVVFSKLFLRKMFHLKCLESLGYPEVSREITVGGKIPWFGYHHPRGY